MEQIIAKIDGMMCGMCESHMNYMVRNNFKVKKVTSSHAKKETVIERKKALMMQNLQKKLRSLATRCLASNISLMRRKGYFTENSN